MTISVSWGASCLVLFGLHACCTFSPTYNVIESDIAPELELHVVTPFNSPVKLKCYDVKNKLGSRVDDIFWEYKRCGHGLSLTACEDLPKNTRWQVALCRNQSKLCTGATLPITDPSESDSGLYRCLYKNYMMRKFRVNRTIQLEVRDPRTKSIEVLPEVPELDNQIVLENQTAVLRCRVRSVTYPHIVWARSDTTVDPTSPATVTMGGVLYQFVNASETHLGPDKLYTSKLFIPRSKPGDGGLYMCFALDARHKVSKQVSLTVIPLLSHYGENSHLSFEIWWIAIALVVSATSCVLAIFFLLQRSRPKMVSVPTNDMEDCETSSVAPVSLC